MVADNSRLEDLNNILRSLKAGPPANPPSLIISIDFGTTYSGVGYIFTKDPEKVHVLDQWPGHTSTIVASQKVPTLIKYGSGGLGFSWGHQVGRRDDKKVEAFKLLLDPSLPTPEYTQISRVRKNVQESVKTPVHAVRDFIGALYRHAIAAIEDKHTQAYSEVHAVKFVVSTPAGWPTTVKTAILGAAREVGVTPVTHITEAEAAACFGLQSPEAKLVALKVGSTILVCDAGGATTDITSYTIRRLKPLEVVEVVPPLTRAGGSLNLDKNFENHIMQNLLEEEEFISLKKSPLFGETVSQFDQDIKPFFTKSTTRQFSVKLKGATLTNYPDGGLQNNTMTLDTRALEVIFMPVANTVCTCITEQINAIKVKKVSVKRSDNTSVDAVILTGGFGSNKYLREFLGDKFPNMKFIQPTNTWTAVLRGAALRHARAEKTFEPAASAASRNPWFTKSSIHYGIACGSVWDENAHRYEPKYWDDWEGVWRCKTVNWLIKRGDNLRTPRTIRVPCYKQCGPHPEQDDFFVIVNLVQSAAIDPPTPCTNPAIRTEKTIKVPIDSIPDELFHKNTRNSDGEVFWQLIYDVVLDIRNNGITMWIDVHGQQFGRVLIT